MLQTNTTVEDGRVRAHETAEAATDKVHLMIDKLAEGAVVGSDRAQALQSSATEQAGAVREQATARANELREQAKDARKQATKDAKKKRKQARKTVKGAKKDARGVKKDAKADISAAREQARKTAELAAEGFRKDVLPRAQETASGLAAAGRRAADEAAVRAPEVAAAWRAEQDPKAALAAARGETQVAAQPKKKRGKLGLLLLALVVGGAAAWIAKSKARPKKDPWAVPAGDPYKAPTTGRESSVPAAGAAAAGSTTGAPQADAPQTGAAAGEGTESTGDAWSSARDWADSSSVPSTTGHVDSADDLATEHLGDEETPGQA